MSTMMLINPYIVMPSVTGPDDVSGLQVWLKADALSYSDNDTVATWTDSSGNGYSPAVDVAGPLFKTSIINSLPVVRFDGAGQYLQWSSFPSMSAAEIFGVVKIDTDPPGSATPTGLWALTGSTEGFPATHYPWTDGSVYDGTFSTIRKAVGNPTPALSSWRIVDISSQASDYNFRLDGTSIYSTATNTYGNQASLWRVGRSRGDYYLDGDIAEVIIYNKVLSAGERTAITTYLQTKYAL